MRFHHSRQTLGGLYGLPPLALLITMGWAAPAKPPKSAAPRVSYEKTVKPLLAAKCGACHGNGSKLGDFQIDTREALLAGGVTHPVVLLGNGAGSYLVKLVSGQIPGKIMPPKGARLTKAEVAILRAWVDAGLPFGDPGTGAAALTWRPTLAPRRPALPANADPLANPIDRLLQPYFAERGITPPALVDDRTYARRVFLDLVGLLPTPEQMQAFLEDTRPDKRALLARRLLADDENYAEHWLSFWNDALRNDYAGTGYIDGGRKQITGWLRDALRTNLPYDRFVAQLVHPTPESEGFVRGIVWRGVVNASQTPEMQAAQNIAQVFLGVNLKCASCHDSFTSNWKLADAYGMAGIYADKPLEMVRCDKRTGRVAPVKFIYPQLGAINGAAPRERRSEELAALLTSPQNGRLTRTLVNRLWARLMGRGLIEPTDEMDSRPWNPDLLDWLASDFADHGYDVKRVMEQIVTARAYQLPATGLRSERASADFVFRGPVVKRLSAEQFSDAVSALTGVWPRPAASPFAIAEGKVTLPPGGEHAAIAFDSDLMRSGAKQIDVDVAGAEVLSLVVTDGGNNVTNDWADWIEPRLVDAGGGETKLTGLTPFSATTGYGQVQIGRNIVEKPLRLGDKTFADGIGTHATSVITYILPPGVTRFRALVGPDAGAVEAGPKDVSIRFFVVRGDRSLIEARAALALADPLLRALGRPNREQVVTQRSTVATTLQALELTNGQTLAERLGAGAERWTRDPKRPAWDMVEGIYETALGRPPTPAERGTALGLVGSPARREGVEDLLWTLVMQPEFQLID